MHQNRFSKRHEAKAERGRRPKIDEPGGNENPDSLDVRSRSARNVEKREDKRARVSKNSDKFYRKLYVAGKYKNYYGGSTFQFDEMIISIIELKNGKFVNPYITSSATAIMHVTH